MIYVAFAIGLLTIAGIARYNKSVSQFIVLLSCLLGGFAGGALADSWLNSNADDTNSVQVQPMLNSPQGIGLFALVDIQDTGSTGSAGKAEATVSDTENSIAPSSNGIVLDVPENPPQPVEIVDDS